jgi:hypothetical protein
MGVGNVLVLPQLATLPADLTRKNQELFAREVMPALRGLDTGAGAPAEAPRVAAPA